MPPICLHLAPLAGFETVHAGRQLFERDTNLATADDSFVEEGTVSVDISQYERSKVAEEDENENERMQFSDED